MTDTCDNHHCDNEKHPAEKAMSGDPIGIQDTVLRRSRTTVPRGGITETMTKIPTAIRRRTER